MGYIVFSTHEKMKEYCDVAKVIIEVPNHRFKLDSDDGEIVVPDIKCDLGEYTIIIDIDFSKGRYCCEFISERNERGYLECGIKRDNVHLLSVNRMAIIHDHSYRYAISEI